MDAAVAQKLRLRPGDSVALVAAAGGEAPALWPDAPVAAPESADAVIVVARDRADLERLLPAALDAAAREALTWIAYPKAGQLGTDLNRDRLADAVAGRLRPVRQVALDDVWSALRFRRPGD
jgi:hypothetical protein